MTKERLEEICRTLNQTCGVVDTYHISFATYGMPLEYGGVILECTMNEKGETFDVFKMGYVTKSHLIMLMEAYLQGIETGKSLK